QAAQVAQLTQARLIVEGLNTEVLMLRRHEKDFMLRGRDSYLDKFEATISGLRQDTRRLEQVLQNQAIDTVLVETFAKNIDVYEQNFSQYVAEALGAGMLADQGLQAELRAAAHQLEEALSGSAAETRASLLQLRREEKDFMLRRDESYRNEFNQQAGNLTRQLTVDQQVLLGDYQDAFNAYVDALVTMGLDENSGVTGTMRAAVHATETNLKDL